MVVVFFRTLYIYFLKGERFNDWIQDVKGNNDLLSLTKPDLILKIHKVINCTSFIEFDLSVNRIILQQVRILLKLTLLTLHPFLSMTTK